MITLDQSNESNQDGKIIVKRDCKVKITTEHKPYSSGSVLIIEGTLINE